MEVAAEVAVLEAEIGGDEDLVPFGRGGGWRNHRRFRERDSSASGGLKQGASNLFD